MKALFDRRVVAVVGAFLALGLALLIGVVVAGRGHKASPAGGPSGALTIEQGAADSRTASTKPLRCFVGGQFVGMATVQECGAKNGVAAQALDVGLDPATGAPATPTGSLAPAPVAVPEAPPAQDPSESAAETVRPAPGAPTGECLRYVGDAWRAAGSGAQTVGQCARTLFEGRCGKPGEALYGRWASQTLRLVPGRVEMSVDNRTFHPLMPQNPQDCSLSSD